ncbi:hypothetical protein G6F16_007200 [Rhizopus arrhizus]|nr:hypothetical protein G6F23_008582 [Rhizopus arrhizus]KAG1424605.1 hypothetical protein G6F58_002302 [Rhizopus delemar]KAG0770447.1 hypothetical protein G6F24_000208 [Rhizopus arrhizus]KAG0784430.1 hypothetical protein G6F22_008317 [Rhizopus arrhizus]KAG0796888.1 hypothetical protein G6F21_000953 [Rhizopus arrhizus]
MELAKLDVFVCIETLRSYVNRLDFKSYKAAHKPRLTTRHRKSRLLWAKEHIHWTKDQWRKVVWSDESCFCVEGSKCIKWGGDDAMDWGCFLGGGFEPLEVIDTSSVDQETYINILANKVPFLVYKCGYARWWKETHQIRGFGYCAAQNPNFSPIRHVWNVF